MAHVRLACEQALPLNRIKCDLTLACEQALPFGRAKRAARERASERRSYFLRYPPNGELARMLMSGHILSDLMPFEIEPFFACPNKKPRPKNTRPVNL